MFGELRLLSVGLAALAAGVGLLVPVYALVEPHGGLPEEALVALGTLGGLLSTVNPGVLAEVLAAAEAAATVRAGEGLLGAVALEVLREPGAQGKVFMHWPQANSRCLAGTPAWRATLEGEPLAALTQKGFSSLCRRWWALMAFLQSLAAPAALGTLEGLLPPVLDSLGFQASLQAEALLAFGAREGLLSRADPHVIREIGLVDELPPAGLAGERLLPAPPCVLWWACRADFRERPCCTRGSRRASGRCAGKGEAPAGSTGDTGKASPHCAAGGAP